MLLLTVKIQNDAVAPIMPPDVRWATVALVDGRYALVRVEEVAAAYEVEGRRVP